MITRQKCFCTEDGQAFDTIEKAQAHEIRCLIQKVGAPPCDVSEAEALLQWLADNGPALADILTTTGSSKPRARAIHGGKKNRKPAQPQMAEVKGNP